MGTTASHADLRYNQLKRLELEVYNGWLSPKG